MIEYEIAENIGVLTLSGEIDHERVNMLREALLVSLANSHLVLVNMEKVTTIDDQCLQALDAAREQALSMNKRMALWGLSVHG